MIIPIITFKTELGFSASIEVLSCIYTVHKSYKELREQFEEDIKGAIETLKEEGLPIPTEEEMKKELLETIADTDLNEIYRIEFINYN